MHKQKVRNKYSYYAGILFVISFSLFLYGIILDYSDNHKLIDPINDVITTNNSDDSTIHIETADGNNKQKPVINNEPETTIPQGDNRDQKSKVLTVDEINDQLRKQIQNKYGIKIYYGEETRGYSVS